MYEIINKITLIEWILLGIGLSALLISILAYLKAATALSTTASGITGNSTAADETPPKKTRQQAPEICLNLSAEQNEYGQITLLLKNTGRQIARHINLDINMPLRVFNAEDLSNGAEPAEDSGKSAILPRLTLLDAESILPVAEILSGKQYEIPAVITMGYGKICDFPVSVQWQDEAGKQYRQDDIITL